MASKFDGLLEDAPPPSGGSKFDGLIEPEILNEQHPDISFGERLRQGNLGPNAASQRKDLLSQGFEVGGEGDDIQVRKPGEKPWRRVDPEGFDWMDILDLGNEATSAVTTTLGAVSAGPGGAALAAGGTEAARLGLANASGFDVGLEDVVTGVGTETLLGGASELGARAIGAAGKWGLSKLRAPMHAAAPPSGLLKPLAQEAGEAAGVKPEVQAFKEAMSGRAAALEAAEGLLKPLAPVPARAAAEAGEEAVEAAPGLLKTPEELDALLKPEPLTAPGSRYPGNKIPQEGIPPGSPDWTPGHVAGGRTARIVQENMDAAGNMSPHGPVTLVRGNADEVAKLWKQAGDEPVQMVYQKNPPKGREGLDPPVMRFFEKAHHAGKAPIFLSKAEVKAATQGMPDSYLLEKINELQGGTLLKKEMKHFGVSRVEDMPREGLEHVYFRSQPGSVGEKLGRVKTKGQREAEDVKHNLSTVWEQTGEAPRGGGFKRAHHDKIYEMRFGGNTYRFRPDGTSYVAGTADEVPVPTRMLISRAPGAAPEEVGLQVGKGQAAQAKTAPSPMVDAIRKHHAASTGPIGKAADLVDKFGGAIDRGLELPGKSVDWASQKLGLDKETSGLLKGAVGVAGLATVRIPAKLMSAAAKKIDGLLQPGGLTRAIQSAPPGVRPALEAIAHALQTKGEAAGKAALFISVKSVGGGPLREWLESDDPAT